MKNAVTYLAIIFLLFLVGCDKEKNDPNSTGLIGKWKMTAAYLDIGNGKGNWKPISSKESGLYVEFKNDGKILGNAFPEYVDYITTDNKLLVFTTKKQEAHYYSFTIVDGELSMSPTGPNVCIEGCGTRFGKIK